MKHATQDPLPCLPETAPFTLEQRAYLNGFLAGLFSRTQVATEKPTAQQPLTISYGSQTGNCETLAKRLAKEAKAQGFDPTIVELAELNPEKLNSLENLVVITSTYGDGDPPDNAREFWEHLNSEKAPELKGTRFSLCALGDSSYPKFCRFGRDMDRKLESLGARRILERVECDVDYEDAFSRWMSSVIKALSVPSSPENPIPSLRVGSPQRDQEKEKGKGGREWFEGRMKTNTLLSKKGSAKEVRHFEIAFENSLPDYETGDALGIQPLNCGELVEEIILAAGFHADADVAVLGESMSLREALSYRFDLGTPSVKGLRKMAAAADTDALEWMNEEREDSKIKAKFEGKDLLDVLRQTGPLKVALQDWIQDLRKLQPRLYSISSSPLIWPDEIHLTVGIVRYQVDTRMRKGVCSTYLADRLAVGDGVKTFLHKNKAFRLPVNQDAPMIMIGPGTGIAPFRAFLNERRARGSRGANWLFFGDQKSETDFLYRDEIENLHRDGLLNKLDLAWSRDGADKVYVQHLMLNQSKDIWDWMERGAYIYVCGDASRMAKDVETAIKEIIRTRGNREGDGVNEYLSELKRQKRYARDVY